MMRVSKHPAPEHLRLQAMFGPDSGHWDVPAMAGVLEEAYELVEHGHINGADCKDFMSANPARLRAGTNPDFRKGAAVEDAAAKLMAGGAG